MSNISSISKKYLIKKKYLFNLNVLRGIAYCVLMCMFIYILHDNDFG